VSLRSRSFITSGAMDKHLRLRIADASPDPGHRTRELAPLQLCTFVRYLSMKQNCLKFFREFTYKKLSISRTTKYLAAVVLAHPDRAHKLYRAIDSIPWYIKNDKFTNNIHARQQWGFQYGLRKQPGRNRDAVFSPWCLLGTWNGNREHIGRGGVYSPEAVGG